MKQVWWLDRRHRKRAQQVVRADPHPVLVHSIIDISYKISQLRDMHEIITPFLYKAKWSHKGKDKWWDPLAWEIPADLLPNTTAVPDTHRVPCITDYVTFPDPGKFLTPVHFTPPLISVLGITIGNKVWRFGHRIQGTQLIRDMLGSISVLLTLLLIAELYNVQHSRLCEVWRILEFIDRIFVPC